MEQEFLNNLLIKQKLLRDREELLYKLEKALEEKEKLINQIEKNMSIISLESDEKN